MSLYTLVLNPDLILSICRSMMIAQTTIALQYIAPAWRGAVIVSFVWFLHRWKTNVFARALSVRSRAAIEREKLLTLDKISSISLFVLGLMALAEAYGVAVRSVMVSGLIGGQFDNNCEITYA